MLAAKTKSSSFTNRALTSELSLCAIVASSAMSSSRSGSSSLSSKIGSSGSCSGTCGAGMGSREPDDGVSCLDCLVVCLRLGSLELVVVGALLSPLGELLLLSEPIDESDLLERGGGVPNGGGAGGAIPGSEFGGDGAFLVDLDLFECTCLSRCLGGPGGCGGGPLSLVSGTTLVVAMD